MASGPAGLFAVRENWLFEPQNLSIHLKQSYGLAPSALAYYPSRVARQYGHHQAIPDYTRFEGGLLKQVEAKIGESVRTGEFSILKREPNGSEEIELGKSEGVTLQKKCAFATNICDRCVAMKMRPIAMVGSFIRAT
ncbi:hypothetical protein JCGZ_02480 [Jatropha curcas]|uniref:Uncharacterized protein n=1 Tax=Jatropha curcas TaxID=180498 RepID=A0A067L261_JATCU|nr:hypothetical protein JCGZ_02480 [Jatropha curcas]